MKVLIAGSNGFVGKNLAANLRNIKDGLVKNWPITIDDIYLYDRNSTKDELNRYCKDCDFVFNLVGVNRTNDSHEFMEGNYGFALELLEMLKANHNSCPVMLSSSIQASLLGRYNNSDYGKSKLAGEELYFNYAIETGSKILVYRFANLFGKWCKPNYNSVVATFCYNIAHDLSITINDGSTVLDLVYIDDLVDEMINALQGKEHHCNYNGVKPIADDNGRYCYVPVSHKVSLQEIANLLYTFKNQPKTLHMPSLEDNSFTKKLYSTYLSYLPKEETIYDLKMNVDQRGSFTEIMKLCNGGQFSVNVSKPGITKGQHWHNSKWELFIVVSGKALIQQRNIMTDELYEFTVSGEKIQAIHMLPGFTHNIINLSNTDDLVTLMWANESFDPNKADTYYQAV